MPLMSCAQYARHRGVSKAAVTKAVQAGRISLIERDGKRFVDSDIADRQWNANTQHEKKHIQTQKEKLENTSPQTEETASTAPESESEQKNSPSTYSQARAYKETFNAKLAKLQYDERVGRVTSVEQVQKEAFRDARIVRDAMMRLPDRLAGELAAETNQFKVHSRLTEEIRKALVSLKDEIEEGK